MSVAAAPPFAAEHRGHSRFMREMHAAQNTCPHGSSSGVRASVSDTASAAYARWHTWHIFLSSVAAHMSMYFIFLCVW